MCLSEIDLSNPNYISILKLKILSELVEPCNLSPKVTMSLQQTVSSQNMSLEVSNSRKTNTPKTSPRIQHGESSKSARIDFLRWLHCLIYKA